MTDNSWRQRHVGLAVAYNAWHFYQATGDTGWLAGRGADLIIEVARTFRSMPTTLRLFREDARPGSGARGHVEKAGARAQLHGAGDPAPELQKGEEDDGIVEGVSRSPWPGASG